MMIIGSVAATETTSNDTTNIQSTTDNVAQATSTSSQSTDTTSNLNTTKSISKVSNTQTNTSVKSSSSTASSTLTVKQSSTKITVNNLTTTRNSQVTFKAAVTTTSGSNVKNGTVIFKINGKSIGEATVSKGVAKLTYTIPSTWTDINYKIIATYNGNAYYSKSTSATSSLKIKTNLATKVSVTNISATNGEKIILKAVLTTTDGKYVKTGKVVFKINGKSVGSSSVSNGGAKLSYTIPNSWKIKNYTLTAVYGDNDYYNGATSKGILTLTSKINPKVVINTTSAISGKSVTLTTTITGKSGKIINGGKVVFKINGKSIGSTKLTNSVAKLTYSIPSSWNGKYSLSVVYGGYGKYNNTQKTSTFTIEKMVNSKISISTKTAVAGQSTTFEATITDIYGNKVTGGKAAFKINGKTIGTVTVSKGVAKLTYSIPSTWRGNYNFTVVYGGYSKFKKVEKTSSLVIYKKGSFTVPTGYESYVKSTTNCEVYNSKIQLLSASLTSTTSSVYSAAVKIYNYVRDSISYSSYYNTKYGAVGTLNKKTGNCVDHSHLLIALMRASNIPARYCHATCSFRSGLVVGHVWAEVYVNGKWYKCDTTSTSNNFNNIVNWYSSTSVTRYTSLSF